jgi:hypothetical protein
MKLRRCTRTPVALHTSAQGLELEKVCTLGYRLRQTVDGYCRQHKRLLKPQLLWLVSCEYQKRNTLSWYSNTMDHAIFVERKAL